MQENVSVNSTTVRHYAMKPLSLTLFFIFLIFVNKYECSNSSNEILNKWISMEKQSRNFVKGLMKEMQRPFLKIAAKTKLTSKCALHLLKLALGLNNAELWAISFISGDGYFERNISPMRSLNYGSYSHCVEMAVPGSSVKRQSPNILFRGQYCTVEISPPLPVKPKFYTLNKPLPELEKFSSSNTTIVRTIAEYAQVFYISPIRIGFCMPSSCKLEDINSLLNSVKGSLPMNVVVRRCETKSDLVVNKEQIIVSCIFGLFLIMVSGGTILDICCSYFPQISQRIEKGAFTQLLLVFSINRSFRSMLNVEVATHYIRPVYGIRFLTMIWLFLGWTYEEILFKPFNVELRSLHFGKNFLLTPVLNYTVAIDTLFFISGLLTSYTVLGKLKQDKNVFRLLIFIFYRLKRTTPSLMLIIALTLCLPWIGSGPIWHDTIDPVVEGCRHNWWTNFLYINNYVGTDKPCLKNSWFIAADFQLYLMTLVIVFIISRHPKVGMMCNLVFALISTAVTGFITWNKNLPPTLLFIHPDPKDRKEFFKTLYYLPYPHAGPCCIGIAVGYVLFNYPKFKIKWWVQTVGWMLSAVVNALVVYGVYNWNQNFEISVTASVLYATTHRISWALVIAWLVLACCWDYGGDISAILSWKAFKPLCRLTFLAFLLYNLTSSVSLGMLKEDAIFQHYYFVGLTFSLIIMTYGISFLAGCIWDAPLLAMGQKEKTSKVNISSRYDLKQQIDSTGTYLQT